MTLVTFEPSPGWITAILSILAFLWHGATIYVRVRSLEGEVREMREELRADLKELRTLYFQHIERAKGD